MRLEYDKKVIITPLGAMQAVATREAIVELLFLHPLHPGIDDTLSPPDSEGKPLAHDEEASLTSESAQLLEKGESESLNPILEKLSAEIDAYWRGELREFHLPLVEQGSSFELEVWHFLRGISYGEILSYEYIAEMLGRPKAARALGNAVAKNRLALLCPCHRVIPKNASKRRDAQSMSLATLPFDVGNYRWGSSRKSSLLAHELHHQT